MTKARDLADLISAGNPLADGAISVAEVSGAAPTASPTFTGTVTASTIDVDTLQNTSGTLFTRGDLNFRSSSGVTPLADFDELGAVTLYYNGSEKIRTNNTGVTVTGTVYTTNVDATNVESTVMAATQSVSIGNNDTGNNGVLYLYGGATGEGGELRIYPSAAEDTTIDNWSIDVSTDDLRFFTSAGTVAYQLAPTGAVSFGSNAYGTSGQVLTSGGSGAAPTWADAGGGAWEYITEVTASTDAYAAFPSSFTDTYDYYKVIAKNVKSPDANQSNFYVEVTANGTTYNSPDYRNYVYYNQSSVTYLYSSGGEFSQNNGVTTQADQVASFEATFYNMRGSTAHKFIRIEGSSRSGYTPLPHNPINAWLSRFDSSAIQGFRFSTDNNISGNFKLYGLNKS